MKNESLLSELFDKKILKVLNVFFENKDQEFHLREISSTSKVPLASTHRIVKKLADMGLIQYIEIKKFKLLKWSDSDKARKLELLFVGRKNPLEFFKDLIKEIEAITTIILYGTPSRDGADLLIIGNEINANDIKSATTKTKEKFGFTVNTLLLNDEQFDQMNRMGLYPKNKKIIYQR